jgi:hypothetical protein
MILEAIIAKQLSGIRGRMHGIIADRAAQRDMQRWLREKGLSAVAQDVSRFGGKGAGALKLLPQSFFLSADFDAFATEFRGANIQEVHRHSLYSYKTYPTTGQVELLFFDQNIGSATNGLGDTNMQVGGQMSGNESMIIMNVRVVPLPARADYDTAAAGTPVAFGEWTEILNRNSWLVMEISDKPYLTIGPLSMFPAGFGPGTALTSLATVTRNIAFPGNGTPDSKALWIQDPPLAVLPNRTLRVYARWRAALLATTAGKIGVVLDGYRIRAVQ